MVGLSFLFLNIVAVFGLDHSIEVKLFGQQCLLNGPANGSVTSAELRVIHAISPEQLPATTTLKQCLVAIEKLKQAKPLPNAFEGYRQGMLENAKAWEAFLKGQILFRKRKKPAVWIDLVRPYLSVSDLDQFNTKLNDPEVRTFYMGRLKAPPEPDFHRVLKKLGIYYQCSFEESGAE